MGRSVEGVRTWRVEFGWTADCTLSHGDITPTIWDPQGVDSNIVGSRITKQVVVDSEAHRVVVILSIPRNTTSVPAGKFDAIVEIGNGRVGLARANLTIRHQEPAALRSMNGLQQVVWSVIWLGLAGVLFALAQVRRVTLKDGRISLKESPTASGTTAVPRTSQDFTTPVAALFMALGLYPFIARVLGSSEVPAPWWPVWFGVAGVFGGFLLAVVKHRAGGRSLIGGYPFAAAIALSFGAGITVWRSQYVNTPDWAMTIESSLALIGVVGGATATSALLLLQPAPDRGGSRPGGPGPAAQGGAAENGNSAEPTLEMTAAQRLAVEAANGHTTGPGPVTVEASPTPEG